MELWNYGAKKYANCGNEIMERKQFFFGEAFKMSNVFALAPVLPIT